MEMLTNQENFRRVNVTRVDRSYGAYIRFGDSFGITLNKEDREKLIQILQLENKEEEGA